MISGIAIALMLVLFTGLAIWAYSGRRASDFKAAADLALDDGASHSSVDSKP